MEKYYAAFYAFPLDARSFIASGSGPLTPAADLILMR